MLFDQKFKVRYLVSLETLRKEKTFSNLIRCMK